MENLTIKMKLNIIEKMFPSIVKENGGIEKYHKIATFKKGAELYYRGKDLWTINSCNPNGYDIEDAIIEILRFKKQI